MKWNGHPAVFSDAIIPVIGKMLENAEASGHRVLDPFAGVGRIHELRPQFETVGIEIEPEWATVSPHTVVANALHLPFPNRSFRFAASSPCYGNRMADSHDAKEKCKACKGRGRIDTDKAGWLEAFRQGKQCGGSSIEGPASAIYWVECEKCGGKGYRSYTRLTYTHRMRAFTGDPGRKLHADNAATLQWGKSYRELHASAWAEMTRVVTDVFILNIKDHYRTVGKGEEKEQVLQGVPDWHARILESLGWGMVKDVEVEVPHMGFGQNREARDDAEHVMLFRRV